MRKLLTGNTLSTGLFSLGLLLMAALALAGCGHGHHHHDEGLVVVDNRTDLTTNEILMAFRLAPFGEPFTGDLLGGSENIVMTDDSVDDPPRPSLVRVLRGYAVRVRNNRPGSLLRPAKTRQRKSP